MCGGLPSHPISVAGEWIGPVLPALRAHAGPGKGVDLWSRLLKRWLAYKAGQERQQIRLRWFCGDIPDLLASAPAAPPSRTTRLFPVVVPEAPDPAQEYLSHEEIAALARQVSERRRMP